MRRQPHTKGVLVLELGTHIKLDGEDDEKAEDMDYWENTLTVS